MKLYNILQNGLCQIKTLIKNELSLVYKQKQPWTKLDEEEPRTTSPIRAHGLTHDHVDKEFTWKHKLDKRKRLLNTYAILSSQKENSTTDKNDTKNQKPTANSKSLLYKSNTTENKRLKYSRKNTK